MSLHALSPVLDRDIQCWGDSLTAGTGTTADLAYPIVLGSLFSPRRAVLNAGVGGETAAQIATRQTSYLRVNTQINVLWAGRNGFASVTAAAIVASIQTMIDHVGGGRYLVLTVPYMTDGTEDADDANGILVQALNTLIISTWPNNYIDIATLLGRDNSLRVDGLHPTAAGYALIANFIYTRILDEGW